SLFPYTTLFRSGFIGDGQPGCVCIIGERTFQLAANNVYCFSCIALLLGFTHTDNSPQSSSMSGLCLCLNLGICFMLVSATLTMTQYRQFRASFPDHLGR